jgi:hypothetical protein
VQVTHHELSDKEYQQVWETPVGRLTETFHYDDYRLSAYNSEYLLKRPEDFKVYEYIIQDERWYLDEEAYEREAAAVGSLGVPQFYFRRSPIQGLFIENMGFENAILFMNDYPEVIERYVEMRTAADDAMYAVLCQSQAPILNFGENIDMYMDPPTIWRKHLVPYFRRRVAQLEAAGKSTYIHVDGAMKRLLRGIRESPFTGIEAYTPVPQGDVTIAEIKEALGDKVLLDGIPAVYFLPTFSFDEIADSVRELVDRFYPHLILGISDEIPPDGDIERVRQVGEMVMEMV